MCLQDYNIKNEISKMKDFTLLNHDFSRQSVTCAANISRDYKHKMKNKYKRVFRCFISCAKGEKGRNL